MGYMTRNYEEDFQRYLWNVHCNGDIFFEYWRPFTYEEWLRNGKPITDGGVKLDDNTEHLVTFRYNSSKPY
jgi:hypothetical protein